MRDVDRGQDLTFMTLYFVQLYSYENRGPRGGMEDGTWSKAYCFVFITCTMGSVGVYRGVVNRQTGDPCLQGSEEMNTLADYPLLIT
jgi:hypothetical protein